VVPPYFGLRGLDRLCTPFQQRATSIVARMHKKLLRMEAPVACNTQLGWVSNTSLNVGMSDTWSRNESPELFFQKRRASTLPNIFSELRTLGLNKRTNSRLRRGPLVEPFNDLTMLFAV